MNLLSYQRYIVIAAVIGLVFFFPVPLRAASILVVTGPDAGHAPVVTVTLENGSAIDTIRFQAYPTTFTGGVRVAVGDVNGDGFADIITAPGAGAPPNIRVFDGRALGRRGSLLTSFNAFPGNFRGGVFVAAGDVNGDGKTDIIVGTDDGVPGLVRVYDGMTGRRVRSFFPYTPSFTGGVRVAAGDVNGDGTDEIVTGGGPGAGPHVKVFSGATLTELQSFFAYDPGFLGGVYVATGDINNDGKADIITGAGPGSGPHVNVFSGANAQPLASFFAYEPQFSGGVRVGAGDVNGDGFADILTGAGPGVGPHVKVFDGTNLDVLHSFFAYEQNFLGGVYVGGARASGRAPR